MQRRGLPLRPTLLTVVVLLILAAAGAVGLLAYRSSKNIVSELWDGYAEQIAQNTMHRTLRYFEPAPPYVEMTQNEVEDGRLSLTLTTPEGQENFDLLDHFDAALSSHPEFTWASFGDRDGTYVSARRLPSGQHQGLVRRVRPEGGTLIYTYQRTPSRDWRLVGEPTRGDYDPRTRPWYKKASESESGQWVEPFLFATTGVPGFMYVKAQRDGSGQVLGVWAVEHEVSHLSHFLEQMKVGQSGQVYVVTHAGLVVGHPGGLTTAQDAQGKPAVAVAQDHPDAMLAAAWAGLSKAKSPGAASFENGPYLVMAQQFPAETSIDWQVLVVVPKDDFFSDVHSQAIVTLVVGIIAAFLAALLGALFASRVSSNLRRIAGQLDKIGHFELDASGPAVGNSVVREVNEMRDTAERMRISLRSFGKFVPKELVRELLLSGAEAELGGKRATLTVLFSDIVGFTSVAESLAPDTLVELLGEYLELMSNTIRAQEGTVDKYIGDAIMAFWGAPRPLEDHALRACQAALEMQRKLDVLNARWAARGVPEFATRIGINTGTVVVGNIGSPERLNYTVIGDPVNVASRLEALAKLYGARILIGEETAQLVAEAMTTRKLDWVAVKGKEKAVAIYELLEDDMGESTRRAHQDYAKGLVAYQGRDFEVALEAFEACSTALGGDAAAELMAERCRAFAQDMPPEDWKGATIMTQK
jgi:adenylate cyclase